VPRIDQLFEERAITTMDEGSVAIEFGFIRSASEGVTFVMLYHGALPTAEAQGGGTTNCSQVTTKLSSVGLDVRVSVKVFGPWLRYKC
jgi:hypothetical protein